MTFNNLNSLTCNCLVGAEESSRALARRTKLDYLRDVDFETYHEKGRLPEDNSKCEEVCGLNGVSLTEYFGDDTQEGLKIISQVVSLAPKYRPYAIIINVKSGGGLAKFTPNETNPHHFDLYKSDDFSLESHIETIKAINLIDVYDTAS